MTQQDMKTPQNIPNKETEEEEQKILEEAWGEYKSDWSISEEEDNTDDDSLFHAVPYDPADPIPYKDKKEVTSLQDEGTNLINNNEDKLNIEVIFQKAEEINSPQSPDTKQKKNK